MFDESVLRVEVRWKWQSEYMDVFWKKLEASAMKNLSPHAESNGSDWWEYVM